MTEETTGNFKEFKTFHQALRYLKKKGKTLPKGSNERKNIKMLFEMGAKHNRAVGVLRFLCPCGYVGDDDKIMMINRDYDKFKDYKKGEIPTMFCHNCMQMSMALFQYGLVKDQSVVALKLIQQLKRGDK